MVESMRKWNEAGRGWMLGVTMVGLVLASVGTGLAQTAAPAKAPTVIASLPAAAEKPAVGDSASKQGIKVSGWWTIDVKNPDGTLAAHREFENALTQNVILPSLLLGDVAIGPPILYVGGNPGPCVQNNTSTCVILLAGSNFSCVLANGCTKSLTATAHIPASGPVDALVLAGSFTALNAAQISAVSTGFYFCGHVPNAANSAPGPAATPPAVCAAGGTQGGDGSFSTTFTTFYLNGVGNTSPVPVTAGQIVQITVTLSFS